MPAVEAGAICQSRIEVDSALLDCAAKSRRRWG
jgi:hypothetical protein